VIFDARRRVEGGTGLGLPIARSLMAASYASITLIDCKTGTTFRLDLPKAL
jgi:signal transduction histidine kinase